ncbi:efflux RND transporter periplasmic adaptor subunit [Limnohabitans radicicola]|uniref:Efflux RND transporter periplasmic adaptor subunit n=1 Tax=Limnohabitans radicicola TaxID=2771427 RepID=A0A927IKZ0_9BURK|nr:efflux RND transporter periplasmic adaptor subunit [Limnohabitans radicicola]MBD8050168.1 efflux RND transporter periplasmic adaptor subunit [Limnohabitans radicicola]
MSLKKFPTLIAIVSLVGLTACQDKAEPVAGTPMPIIQNDQLRYPAGHPQLPLLVSTPATAAKAIAIELPARLVWNEEKTQRIYPAFAGRVTHITADVGQSVGAGQVLAQLASPEFGAAQADTSRAVADATLARQALQRQRELFEAGVVARKDLEQAEADAARTQAEVARAQARTSLYGSASGVNQQLGLRSDIRGVVVERNLNPGQEVRPDGTGPAMFVVSDPSTLWVQIDAQEADVGDLRPGVKVGLVVPTLSDQKFEATVQAVTDQIDPTTRTIKIRATVSNPKRLLKNEMLAKVRYERKVGSGLEVPATAVFLRGNQHYVFVQSQAGVFEPRDVTVSYEGPKQVLLSSGLKDGEQVVSQNGLLLARELRIAQEAAHAATQAKP